MNIFALDPIPEIAASYHCDQHLNKMILESAQMISTALFHRSFAADFPPGLLYKPAYEKHPCTLWASASNHNLLWLCELACNLEHIRTLELDRNVHASATIPFTVRDYLREHFPHCRSDLADPFATAMPGHISVRNDLSPVEKYQRYYQYKSMQRGLTRRGRMTYTHRSIPSFMIGFTQT